MTPYQQLVDLFSTSIVVTDKITGNEKHTQRSGKANLAKSLGVSHSLVIHWETRYGGALPAEYYRRILDATDAAGISRDKVEPLFAGCACPTCGRPVGEGARA